MMTSKDLYMGMVIMTGVVSGSFVALYDLNKADMMETASYQISLITDLFKRSPEKTPETVTASLPERSIPPTIPEDKVSKVVKPEYNFTQYPAPTYTKFTAIKKLGKVAANFGGKYYIKGFDCTRNGCSSYMLYDLEFGRELGPMNVEDSNNKYKKDIKAIKLFFQKDSTLLVMRLFTAIECKEQQFEMKDNTFIRVDTNLSMDCES